MTLDVLYRNLRPNRFMDYKGDLAKTSNNDVQLQCRNGTSGKIFKIGKKAHLIRLNYCKKSVFSFLENFGFVMTGC